jgi:hypothetical protein
MLITGPIVMQARRKLEVLSAVTIHCVARTAVAGSAS